MQPYKPKFTSYKPKYSMPTFSEEDKTRKALESQRTNLEARLQGVGVDPANLDDVDNRNFIRKALNLDEDKGLLMSTFEIINRPQQAVVSGLAGEGFMAGLTGENKMTGVEFLDKMGVVDKREIDGVGEFALNMVTSMVTDPLYYVGGPVKLVKKALGAKSKFRLPTTEETVNLIATRADEVVSGSIGPLTPVMGKGKAAKTELYKVYTRGEGKLAQEFRVYTAEQLNKSYALNDGIYQKLTGKGQLPKLSKASQTERDVANLLTQYTKETFGKYSDNVEFLQGLASENKYPDITVAYKLNKNGQDLFVEVGQLEVKDLGRALKDQANLLSFRFDLSDGKIVPNDSASKNFDKDILTRFTKYLENSEASQRVDIQNLIQKLKVAGKADKKSIPLEKLLDKDDLEQMNSLIKELAFDKYQLEPYIGVIDGKGNLKIVSSNDVIQATESTGAFVNLDNGMPRFQAKFGKGVDVDDLADYSEEFFNEFFEKKSIISGQVPTEIREPGLVMNFINRKALEQESMLRKPAQFVKDTMDSLGFMFNANKGLGTDFIGNIRRIRGRSGQMLHENNKILSKLKKEMTTNNPEAAKLLSQISEAEYIIDNGRLITQDRVYTAQEILENFANNGRVGSITTLPRFANDMAKRNFEDVLNSILEVDGLKVAVEVKGNATRLVLTEGTEADLYQLAESLKSAGAIGGETPLSFGKIDLSEEAQKFFFENQENIEKFKEIQKTVQDILVSELGYEAIPEALRGKMGYMRHTLTQEAKKGLREISAATADAYASRGVDTLKQRTFLGTVEEVNAALSEWADVPFDVLDNNAFTSMQDLIRVTSTKMEQDQVLKAVMDGTSLGGDSLFKVFPTKRVALDDLGPDFKIFEKGFKDEFSSMYKNLSPSSQKVVNDYFANLGGAEGVAAFGMHKSAYNILKQVDRAYMDLPKFVKSYDKFLNYWKSVTLISPGFHMRNIFGNYTNSYIAGMSFSDIATQTTTSVMDFQTFYKVKEQAINQGIDTLSAADQEVYRRVLDFFESGIAQTRKGTRDLELLKDTLGKEMLSGDTSKIKQAYNQLVKVNFDVAEYIDDIQRYNLYQWALKNKGKEVASQLAAQGASKEIIDNAIKARAYETVSGALFDYQNLTTFERDVMKRVFPFYTFMKNNFIFQAKNLLSKPFKYAQIGRAWQYWNEDMGGIKTEDMPSYMQERMWLALPMTVRKDDADAISFLKLNLTISDFTELVKNPFWKGVTSVTAPVKLAFELGTGRDSFSGQPLERFPGEKRRLEAGEGVLPFLRDPRGNLALTANPTVQKVLNDLGLRMPQNYLSIALDGLDRVFGYKKAGELTPAVFDRLSLTGTQTVDSIELTRLYQDLNRLRNLQRYYAQEQGEPLPSLDEIARRQGRMPRLP